MKGDREHLQRWCEYVDDWTANSLRDQDDFVYGMRMATDLEPQFARCMLNLLRIILDERPELALDFDAATLARLTMKLVSDYIPYVIRCRRAQMANWGIMSLAHQLHLCRFLSEFKAMRYFNRETWRLWSANMIQHQTLDGENFEAWDEGHNFVSLYCFAPGALTFANNLNARDQHETSRHSSAEAMLAILSKGADIAKIQRKPTPFPVSVRWKSSGKQLFITALHSRSAQGEVNPATDENLSKVEHLNGATGIRGCKLSMRSGTEVWLQSSPNGAQALTCGLLKVQADCLLFVQKKEGPARGIVLGCRELSVNGRPQPITSTDFEFELTGTEFGIVQNINRPIDTVCISPAQNVFTDRVDVSFDIPNQKINDIDFRYTLDGSEPTIASPLYQQPIPLNRTTTVKVRPFRKGLTQTPWTFSGTDSGKTISATFRQRVPFPAIKDPPKRS